MNSGWPWPEGESDASPDEDDLRDERPTVGVNLDDLKYWVGSEFGIDQPDAGE